MAVTILLHFIMKQVFLFFFGDMNYKYRKSFGKLNDTNPRLFYFI